LQLLENAIGIGKSKFWLPGIGKKLTLPSFSDAFQNDWAGFFVCFSRFYAIANKAAGSKIFLAVISIFALWNKMIQGTIVIGKFFSAILASPSIAFEYLSSLFWG